MMRSFLGLLSGLLVGLVGFEAHAEQWPTKPLRVIVPLGAGGIVDVVPRIVLEQLSIQLGQTIVVENRPGAGSSIGAVSVAKADPDGYTILANGPSHTIASALYPSLGYHPSRDFAAVVPLGVTPSVLVAPKSKGWKTAADLVAAGRSGPSSLNFSSVGVGTATHLSAERFLASTGIKAAHVPFKSGPEALTEVLAARVDFFFGPVGLVGSHVLDGKLSALAVNGYKRSSALPDVPTTSEVGITNAQYPLWIGLFLPAKAPREIVDKLSRETLKALQEPKVRSKLVTLGIDPMPMSPAEFQSYVDGAIVADAELVRAINLRPN